VVRQNDESCLFEQNNPIGGAVPSAFITAVACAPPVGFIDVGEIQEQRRSN